MIEIRWLITQLNHHHIGPILVQRREAKRLAAAEAETRRLETARVAATKAESTPSLQRIEDIWKEVSRLKAAIAEDAEKIKGMHIAAGKNYGRGDYLDFIRNLRESSAGYAAAASNLISSISASRNLLMTSAKRGKVDEIQTELNSILSDREEIVDIYFRNVQQFEQATESSEHLRITRTQAPALATLADQNDQFI